MGTTKIKFESIDANQKVSVKSYGDANPNATDYTLKSMVTGAYALSKNNVGKIYRINTTDITHAADGGNEPIISGKTASLVSTSDFLSNNAATFHTFLQSAYNALEDEDKDELTAIDFEVVDGEENGGSATISYGDIATLLANTNADSGDFATLVTGKLEEEDVDVTMSCAANTLTFSGATDFTVTITEGQGGASGVGHIILQSLYNGATDKTAFSTEENNDDAEPYTSYTLELQSA